MLSRVVASTTWKCSGASALAAGEHSRSRARAAGSCRRASRAPAWCRRPRTTRRRTRSAPATRSRTSGLPNHRPSRERALDDDVAPVAHGAAASRAIARRDPLSGSGRRRSARRRGANRRMPSRDRAPLEEELEAADRRNADVVAQARRGFHLQRRAVAATQESWRGRWRRGRGSFRLDACPASGRPRGNCNIALGGDSASFRRRVTGANLTGGVQEVR